LPRFAERSANGTQPNFARRWAVNRVNNLSQKSQGLTSAKIGSHKTYGF